MTPRDVFIVAEIGKNFIQTPDDRPQSEYVQNAIALIDAAVDAGADAVKFQTHVAEDEQLDLPITSPHFPAGDRYRWVCRNELATPPAFWRAVTDHCRKRGIPFFSTPMSRLAARRLAPFDPPMWKVSSGDTLDFLLLRELCASGKPVIISTGMVGFEELDRAVGAMRAWRTVPSILYCVSHYPCPPEMLNLAMIGRLRALYPGSRIGFSDHTIGNEHALAAVARGATIIEKHFSLSRDLWGSDHKVSTTPAELGELVRAIRAHEYRDLTGGQYANDPDQELDGATNTYRGYFRKVLVAARDLPASSVLDEEALYAMRPAALVDGFASDRVGDVVGRAVMRPLRKYAPLTADLLS